MHRYELKDDIGCVYYVSSKCRTWRSAKTIVVLAPDEVACSAMALDRFAQTSGWLDAAEQDGAVLVLPLATKGWQVEDTARMKKLYLAVWRDSISPQPDDIRGNVWCWETLIFLVGYGTGAVYAGNTAVAHPNAFADVAMIDGVPDDYSAGNLYSDQWLLPDASPESVQKNCNIPVSVWFLGNADTCAAEAYFGASASNPDQVTVMRGSFKPDSTTTRLIMHEFCTRIRWKNSPNGTPARCLSEETFRSSGEYQADYVKNHGLRYDYYTRLPRGVQSAEGMPVVISLHGHGESARLFCQKNGWPELADETKEFVLVLPDSPENAWQVWRDEAVMEKMIDKLHRRYNIDRTRVYLTGFSNGAMATSWYGTRHPQLFAALSPWNTPLAAWEGELAAEGWQMPMFAINGDKDHKISFGRRRYDELFSRFISLNGGTPQPAQGQGLLAWKSDEIWDASNRYTQQCGYEQGDRMVTCVFHNAQGAPRVCYTEIKDMPHGAIADEARAAWSFLRRFSRPEQGKAVVDSGCK